MPAVLTSADSLTCSVGQGEVQTTGAAKLVVAGNPVLTVAGVTGKPVSGCKPPNGPPPPPCTMVGPISAGQAMKLFVEGAPVLLSTFAATGAPPPATHPITAMAGQTKLEAS